MRRYRRAVPLSGLLSSIRKIGAFPISAFSFHPSAFPPQLSPTKETGTIKKGQEIRVYQDPHTKQHLEGVARLVRRGHVVCDSDQRQYWSVRFAGEGEPAVARWVDPADVVTA